MNIHDLTPGRYAAAHLADGRTAYIRHDDPLYAAARRQLDGKPRPGDEAALTAWLDARVPAPGTEAALWRGEWLQPTLWEAA